MFALNYRNFVKENFKVNKNSPLLTFIYKDYIDDYTFTINTGETMHINSGPGTETIVQYLVQLSPGETFEQEQNYSSMDDIPLLMQNWLENVEEVLEAKREQQWEGEQDKIEKVIENYINENFHESNSVFSKIEIKQIDKEVDYWKEHVGILVEEAYTNIAFLKEEIEELKRQFNSFKNDARHETKSRYTKSVLTKICLMMLTYPEAAKQIFSIAKELLPKEYQGIFDEHLVDLLNAQTHIYLPQSDTNEDIE